MIVCINCNQETKKRMDCLIRDGSYKDYSEIVSLAIGNLWIMEQDVAINGGSVVPDSVFPPTSPRTVIDKKKAGPSSTGKPSIASINENRRQRLSYITPGQSSVRIPDLFASGGLDQLSVATVKVPYDEKNDATYSLDRWLFGQYNKLLPIKANCRALIRLVAGQEKGELLDVLGCKIAEASVLLGDYLADFDRRHLISRDDALSTAFPHSGLGADKSLARYANQFVGNVNGQGVLSGLLCDYHFVSQAPEEGRRVIPTEPAIKFAQMLNPILDAVHADNIQRFSQEESSFMLDHIRFHVPVERFTFQTLIKNIADGADTPEKLDEALRGLIPTDLNRSFSPSFLASQRSGALSRMADISLIARVRKGVRVYYSVTERGRSFIESR